MEPIPVFVPKPVHPEPSPTSPGRRLSKLPERNYPLRVMVPKVWNRFDSISQSHGKGVGPNKRVTDPLKNFLEGVGTNDRSKFDENFR